MKKIISLLLCICIILTTAACGSAPDAAPANSSSADSSKEDTKTETEAEPVNGSEREIINLDEFTITLPSSWRVVSNEDGLNVIKLDNCTDGFAVIGVVETEGISIQNKEDISGVIKDFVEDEGLEIEDEFYLDIAIDAYAYVGSKKETEDEKMVISVVDANRGLLIIEMVIDSNSADPCFNEYDELMASIVSQVQESSEPEQHTNEIPKEASITESVIHEDDYCTITAKSLTKKGEDYELTLLIENKSQLNLGFNAHAWAANGIMSGNNIYDMDVDVAAGKKTNAILEIDEEALYGLPLETVDLLLWAYDNDKHVKEFDTGQIHIETNINSGNKATIQGTEKIFEDSGINVSFHSNQGNSFFFVISNDSGGNITIDVEDVSINDFTSSNTDYDLRGIELLNNCEVLCEIKVRDDFLAQNDIDNIEVIEWNMNIRPNGSYMDEYKIGPVVKNI